MIDRYPHIFPVTYALDGSLVTFRTGPGTKFAASQHHTVCFQADQIEAAGRAAWSVLVLGAVQVPDCMIRVRCSGWNDWESPHSLQATSHCGSRSCPIKSPGGASSPTEPASRSTPAATSACTTEGVAIAVRHVLERAGQPCRYQPVGFQKSA